MVNVADKKKYRTEDDVMKKKSLAYHNTRMLSHLSNRRWLNVL